MNPSPNPLHFPALPPSPPAQQSSVVPLGKIVLAEDFSPLAEASSLLDAARREADEIRVLAMEAFLKEKARGYEEGKRQAERDLSERMVRLAVESVSYLEAYEARITGALVAGLQRVIGEFSEAELLGRVVGQSLQIVRQQARVTVRVSSAHHSALQAKVDSWKERYPAIRTLDLQADSQLPPDECVLDTEIGSVSTGVHIQIQAITNALESCFGHAPASE